MNKETLIINIQERFHALEHALSVNDSSFTLACFEYTDLINASEEISDAVRSVLLNDDFIDKHILQSIFNISMLKSPTNRVKPGKDNIETPRYWNNQVEKRYRLLKDFYSLIISEKRRLDKSKSKDLKFEDDPLQNDKDPSLMTDDEMLFGIRILNNKIISKLSSLSPAKHNLSFNSGLSILTIDDIHIKITKFSDQYHTLRIIFEDPKELNEEWFFSEISKKYDNAKDLPDKKFYNAIYQIGLKTRASGIPDLFIATRQSVKINEIYLS